MAADSPELKYSQHAEDAMAERKISKEWVKRTVAEPRLRLPDRKDCQVELFYRPILEYGNRVLRVAVNTCGEPWQVVTAFFDRNMKGKL